MYENLLSLLFNTSFLSLFIMNILFFSKKKQFGYILLAVSNFEMALLLGLRWFISGYFPSSNLYESLLFLTWCLTFMQMCFPFWSFRNSFTSQNVSSESSIWVQDANQRKPSGFSGDIYQGDISSIAQKHMNNSADLDMANYLLINQITAPISLILHAFASLKIPKELTEMKPLVPALKSNWLIMHVSVMILSYAALLIGSLLAILYCFLLVRWVGGAFGNQNTTYTSPQTKDPHDLSRTRTRTQTRIDSPMEVRDKSGEFMLSRIDSLSYQFIAIGFPLLTLGIVSGSVWANETWGSFWNWDIKETWSLVTWLVYAFYIHSRLQFYWQGKPSAIVASLGFFVVGFTYLGVNLMGVGLHSYGWLT
jgi:cytochrome c-type biogenesis protein CcsB